LQRPALKASAALAVALRQAEGPADTGLIIETLASAATREPIPDLLRALQGDVATEEVLDALAHLVDSVAVPALVEQLDSPNALRRHGIGANR